MVGFYTLLSPYSQRGIAYLLTKPVVQNLQHKMTTSWEHMGFGDREGELQQQLAVLPEVPRAGLVGDCFYF